jgi:hypothetical protein
MAYANSAMTGGAESIACHGIERGVVQRMSLFWAVMLVLCAFQNAHASKLQPVNQYTEAKKRFAQRCLQAGEKITRVVADVDGVFLLKIRPRLPLVDEQYDLNDPYGYDLSRQAYIESFLQETYDVKMLTPSYIRKPKRTDIPSGYKFVEMLEPSDNLRYRYTGFIDEPGKNDPRFMKGYFRFNSKREVSKWKMPRYGVTFDDISTLEDRKYWIAGSSLKIIDLNNREVIAERVGYMFDPAQGSRAGNRQPWLEAAAFACPAFGPYPASQYQILQTVRFTEKVLQPARRDK